MPGFANSGPRRVELAFGGVELDGSTPTSEAATNGVLDVPTNLDSSVEVHALFPSVARVSVRLELRDGPQYEKCSQRSEEGISCDLNTAKLFDLLATAGAAVGLVQSKIVPSLVFVTCPLFPNVFLFM